MHEAAIRGGTVAAAHANHDAQNQFMSLSAGSAFNGAHVDSTACTGEQGAKKQKATSRRFSFDTCVKVRARNVENTRAQLMHGHLPGAS